MSDPHERLGDAVAARLQQLAMSHRTAAEASRDHDPAGDGVSIRTVTAIVSSEPRRPHPRTAGIMERTLGWPTGTFAHVLAGGDPPSFVPPADAEERIVRLEAQVAELTARLDALNVVIRA